MKAPHPVLGQLRELRKTRGESLRAAAKRIGVPDVVLGSYERGDRSPTVERLDVVLRAGYGMRLAVVPAGQRDEPTPDRIADDLVAAADHVRRIGHTLGVLSDLADTLAGVLPADMAAELRAALRSAQATDRGDRDE